MSTSGSFTPAGNPCPAPMTRAALLALRTAGALRPECHYIITDGPVIGTAGNTSGTVIELHAVTSTDIAREAKVHTTFDNVAFEGTYDIDAGTSGSLNALTDHWNNHISDEDANAPTVHTQFPYHLSGPFLRDNTINDCTLTGWAGQTSFDIHDNDMKESTVDLTGTTTLGRLADNTIERSTVTSHALQTVIEANSFQGTTVSVLGTPTGFGCTQNTFVGGEFIADAASTASVTLSDNVVGGTQNGYRIHVTGKTTGAAVIQGNRLTNRGTAAEELLIAGTGAVTVTANEIRSGAISLDGSGVATVTDSTIAGSNITRVSGSSAPLHFTRNQFTNAVVSVGAANAAVDNLVDQSTFRGGVLDLRGPVAGGGRNDFVATTVLALQVIVAATATAGLRFDGGVYNKGAVNQNRTAGTLSTVLNDCTTLGITCVITDNGTVDPGQPVNLNRLTLVDSPVTIGSLAAARTAPDVVTQVDMNDSLLFVSGLPGTSQVRAGRMLDANLTTAFEVTSFTLDGLVKTASASQNHRHGSPAFDNWT